MTQVILESYLMAWLLINLGLYLLTVISVLTLRGFITQMHSRLFKLDEDTTNQAIHRYIAHYKLFIVCVNFPAWLALYAVNHWSIFFI